MHPGDHADRDLIGAAQQLQALIGTAGNRPDQPGRAIMIAADSQCVLAAGSQGEQPVTCRGGPGPPPVVPSLGSIVTIPHLMPSKAVTASSPVSDQHGLPQIRTCGDVIACAEPDQITT